MNILVDSRQQGYPLREVIRQASGMPEAAVQDSLRKKEVRLDGIRVDDGDLRVRAGQEIRVYWDKRFLRGRSRPVRVVYQDRDILIMDKPQGLLSVCEDSASPADNALDRVREYLRMQNADDTLFACHRLDVQTGGLLLFARSEDVRDEIREMFEMHRIQKTYTCIVKGIPSQQQREMTAYLRKDPQAATVSITDYPSPGSARILTRYRILETLTDRSRLEVEIITGRTHQIRAHLAHIGHPIVGDDKYGDRDFNRRAGITRQQLFATRMILSGGRILSHLSGRVFEAPCPF